MKVITLRLVMSCAVLVAAVDAAVCPKICSQKTLWGIGPASTGYAPCECTTNLCGCGVCYVQTGNKVTAFAVTGDGSCPFSGTNCGNCDLPSDSGETSSSTKTTAPPTAGNTSLTTTSMPPATLSPSPAQGPTNNTATGVTSDGTVNRRDAKSSTTPSNATTPAPPSTLATPSLTNGLALWQIALFFCSGVLVMAVATMTFMSCYFKTRNRMKDNMEEEEEFVEYEDYWNPNASGRMTNSDHEQLRRSAIHAIPMNGRGSSNSTHSRSSSTERMSCSEPAYAAQERISAGMGRSPLDSNSDLPGVFQVFPQRDGRPNHQVGSRKNNEVEL